MRYLSNHLDNCRSKFKRKPRPSKQRITLDELPTILAPGANHELRAFGAHKRASYPFTFAKNQYVSVFFPYKNAKFCTFSALFYPLFHKTCAFVRAKTSVSAQKRTFPPNPPKFFPQNPQFLKKISFPNLTPLFAMERGFSFQPTLSRPNIRTSSGPGRPIPKGHPGPLESLRPEQNQGKLLAGWTGFLV